VTSPYQIAQGWSGTREGDAKLNDFLYNGGRNLSAAERAWCSDFVKATAEKAGIKTNATGMARSWLNEGQPVTDPQTGDVVVLSRTNDPSLGHVGFYEGKNPDGSVRILSGNHANSVASASYPAERVLGYRRLAGQPETFDPATGQTGPKPLAMTQEKPTPMPFSLAAPVTDADPAVTPAAAPAAVAGISLPFGLSLGKGEPLQMPEMQQAEAPRPLASLQRKPLDMSALMQLAATKRRGGLG
jgi:uncharacterized protein (TIGR02594 family)